MQTERQHSYRFLLEEIEGLRVWNSWNPMTAFHSYTVQLCDVLALRATCKIMLRLLALYPSLRYCTATTWLLAQRAYGQGRPQIVLTAVLKIIYMPLFFCFIKYKSGGGRGRPCPGFQSTWHCEYAAGSLSYHTAPWYFITSHDVMFKIKLHMQGYWSWRV